MLQQVCITHISRVNGIETRARACAQCTSKRSDSAHSLKQLDFLCLDSISRISSQWHFTNSVSITIETRAPALSLAFHQLKCIKSDVCVQLVRAPRHGIHGHLLHSACNTCGCIERCKIPMTWSLFALLKWERIFFLRNSKKNVFLCLSSMCAAYEKSFLLRRMPGLHSKYSAFEFDREMISCTNFTFIKLMSSPTATLLSGQEFFWHSENKGF